MKPSLIAVFAAACATFACGDGQAGTGYRGEPLMSLNGVVGSTTVALDSELVPALMFEPGIDELLSETRTTHFLLGEVEGTFPNAFTMRVYDPPVADVVQNVLAGEPGVASAGIVAVHPGHPRWLRSEITYDETSQLESLCDDRGECLQTDYSECVPVTGDEQGDPSQEWPCGQGFPDDLPWETYGYSQRHSVMYLAADAAAGGVLSRVFAGGAAIAAGYHVVEYTSPEQTLTPEQLEAYYGCQRSASEQAFVTVNEVHGTDFGPEDIVAVQENVDTFRSYQGGLLTAMAELGCTFNHAVVETAQTPVELAFTDRPGIAAF